MAKISKTLLLLAALAVAGCSQIPWTVTRKQDRNADPGPPPTQRWCYRTLADTDCYTQPKPGMYDRLVNVDPPSLFPSSAEDYAKLFAGSAEVKAAPPSKSP